MRIRRDDEGVIALQRAISTENSKLNFLLVREAGGGSSNGKSKAGDAFSASI